MTTTHRVTQERGPHVVDGVVQWFSATVLTAADERADGGCRRKHWYTYCRPGGDAPAPTKAQGRGLALHAELERKLRGEEVVLSSLAMKMHRAAGDVEGALVEVPVGDLPGGRMTCAEVPFFGHSDGVIPRLSVNEVEVLDWKGTKSIAEYAKTGPELLETVQMISYGEWSARKWSVPRIRLTHVYGQTKGAELAERRSVLATREQIAAGWEYVESVGRRVVEHAPCESPEDVPANPAACGAYGGCPYRAQCSVGRRTMLMGIMSKVKASAAKGTEEKAPEAPPPAPTVTETSVQDQIRALEEEAEKCRAAMGGLQPTVTPPDAPPSEHPLPEEPKRGRGRPKGSTKKVEKPAGLESGVRVTEVDKAAGTVTFSSEGTTWPQRGLEVYVDTIQTFPTESLHPYLARICRALCDAHGALDVRAAAGNSDLAFGRWKGYLAEAIRQEPPPAGSYSLDTRGSEVAEVAADVFRDLAAVFVRGYR